MKKTMFLLWAILLTTAVVSGQESYEIWNGPAPGEPDETTRPTCELYQPAEKKTDACLIVFPGGGYHHLAVDHEGAQIAHFFTAHGMTTVVVKYRVPRREGQPKHLPAWQDAQRAVRFVRSHAAEWGINPDKMGVMGFSAGGHLTLMTATTSLTNSYEPQDDLDKVSASVQFAVPVYPAYVLEDGADGVNSGKGNDSKMVKDFAFDAATPPMCFIHGDEDGISAMGSVAVYHQLRKMNIPGELHIFSKTGHGFGANVTGDHVGDWLNRVWAWMVAMGYGA
ncbi:MAG: alpha/beta hydrolase [Planctomycetia bacterium]|nr:alpha/beta hydrolase [Planctomycetia bacterium]